MKATIEFLNELVDRFTKSVKANRETPGRRGSVIHLGPAEASDVFVVGDLHGNRGNFNRAVKFADLDTHPKRHLVLQEVVHGGPTYPGGGCMSHMLLEDVAALKVRYPDRVHFLLSNHELSECMKTSLSKGGRSQNHEFAIGLENAYGPAAATIAEHYRQFILSCPLGIRLQSGVFISHTLPDKGAARTFDPKVLTRDLTNEDLLEGGSAHGMVWGREHGSEFVGKFAKLLKVSVFVHGHEPTPAGFQIPNEYQIILDASGPACWCVVLPLDKPASLEDVKNSMKQLSS
jgi:hypothetical protein